MISQYRQGILKNVQYVCYFMLWNTSSTVGGLPIVGKTGISGTLTISKDAGSFNSTSNNMVEIGSGFYKITLTATEMNADVVNLYYAGGFGASGVSVIIETVAAELVAAPSLNSTIAQKITAIFQYHFFKRTVTSTTETLKQSDGSTTLATSTVSDDGTTFTHGAIS